MSSDRVGLYLVPFAIGNFMGPITLGRLFDTVGRRKMIAFTYSLSAVLLLITGTFRPPDKSAMNLNLTRDNLDQAGYSWEE